MLQPQCKTMWNVVLPALKSFNPLGGRECWRPCLWDFAKGLANELSGCSSHPSNSDGIHELTCLRCLRRSLRPLRHDVYVVHILPCKVSQGAADVRYQMVSTWDATTKESSAGGVSSHQVPNSGGPTQPDMPFRTGWASCPSCRYDIGISNTPTLTFEWLVFDIPSDVSLEPIATGMLPVGTTVGCSYRRDSCRQIKTFCSRGAEIAIKLLHLLEWKRCAGKSWTLHSEVWSILFQFHDFIEQGASPFHGVHTLPGWWRQEKAGAAPDGGKGRDAGWNPETT